MAAAEDAAVLLAEVVSSLDNLPSEVHHILQEIGHKEGKTNDVKNRAMARDQSIQRHARPTAQGGQGLLVNNPKEDSLITKIRTDLDRAEVSAKEKVALSERGVNLLSRHLNRLQTQLELLTPNVPPLPTLPSFTPAAQAPPTAYAAAPVSQAYNPNAGVQSYHNPYAANAYGGGGAGGYGYGSPMDKRKVALPQTSPPVPASPVNGGSSGGSGQVPLLPASHHSPHPQSPGYPYSPAASAQAGTTPGTAQSRMARHSRLQNVTTYPNGAGGSPQHLQGGQGQAGGPQQQQQQLAHQQLAQQQHLQQQQMRLQVQAQALAAQQMANQQQQMHQLQQGVGGHGHGHGHGGHAGHGGAGQQQKRKRQEEEESADTGEENAEGEDMTPYCFCHRPSFGEMIGCDAPNCAIEWFHLACVGLKTVPDASWYCRDCEGKQKNAGGRRRK